MSGFFRCWGFEAISGGLDGECCAFTIRLVDVSKRYLDAMDMAIGRMGK